MYCLHFQSHTKYTPMFYSLLCFVTNSPIPLCSRYRVKCEGDKLLSYNFVSHTLESRSSHCGNSCVDSVKIDFPNYGNAKLTTCGMEAEMGVIKSDGTTEIDVEFVANRAAQAHGFMMFVWCSDPAFDSNAQNAWQKRDTNQYFECAEPDGTHRKPVDAVELLVSAVCVLVCGYLVQCVHVCACVCVHITDYDRLQKCVFITRSWVQRFSCPQSSFVGSEVTTSPLCPSNTCTLPCQV